ncbi:MAG: hypothetical protein ABI723_23735 [Bacteroidia bacterium]
MEDQDQQKSSKATIILLVVALLGSLGANLYQFNKGQTTVTTYESRVDTLETARTEIETELNATYAELEKYKGQNAVLDSTVNDANVKIDEQKTRINQILKTVKNKDELNKKLQEELVELRKLRDNYLDKIDSLIMVNQQLATEKMDLTTRVDSLNKNLTSTVNTASLLRAEYIKVIAYKKRGTTKYSETAMAKRTNKMEVQFKILENKIAKSGEKTVYLRITEPGGKVLGSKSDGSGSMKANGEDILFTASTPIQYANATQDLSLNWEEATRNFAPGTYSIEIYVDGKIAGISSFSLK